MSAKFTYRVSIQWGKGVHYFIGGVHTSYRLARRFACVYLSSLLVRHGSKRGARPTAHVWQLATSVH